MIHTDNNRKNDFDETKDFDISQSPVKRQDNPVEPRTTAPQRTAQSTVSRTPTARPRQQTVPLHGSVSATKTGQNRPTVNGSRAQEPTRVIRTGEGQTPSRPIARSAPSSAQPTQTIPKPTAQKPQNRQDSVQKAMMATRVDAIDFSERDRAQAKRDRIPKEKKEDKRSANTNTLMSIVKAVVYIMAILVISVFLAVAIIKVGNDVFAFVKSTDKIEVTIPENATTDDIATILGENGVIEYPKVFTFYAKLRHDNGEYLAGTYTVTPMDNYDTLIAAFKPKAVAGTIDITIPEGYSTDEIIDLFVENGIGTREGFVDAIENGEYDYWFLDELTENGIPEGRIYRLDGYLFPDTYQFYLASSEWTVINKLLRRFSQIFTREYRDQCEVLGMTVDEIVTLASYIEKEAASSSEFFLVSSVFHNRMNAKWNFPRFESDATVVYAIEHETGERTVDLTYDSPYNTYLYEGFTPGPIANPSASAMLAALSPQDTNYYYFVSDKNKTYFSATKAEHDAYIAQIKAGTVSAIPEDDGN